MNIIAIKDMSIGNDTVGEAWKETKIFNDSDSLADVMKWVGLKKNAVLSVPDGQDYPPAKVGKKKDPQKPPQKARTLNEWMSEAQTATGLGLDIREWYKDFQVEIKAELSEDDLGAFIEYCAELAGK